MIRIGTQCYVLATCRASARTRCAVGRIVQVVSAPYDAPDWTYLPGTYYDVDREGRVRKIPDESSAGVQSAMMLPVKHEGVIYVRPPLS